MPVWMTPELCPVWWAATVRSLSITASRMSAKRMRKIRVFSREGYVSLDYGDKRALLFRPSEAVRRGQVDPRRMPPEPPRRRLRRTGWRRARGGNGG